MSSKSCQEALTELRRIKPNDGWSVQEDEQKGFRLLRRNVPLSDNFFRDIHYCSEQKIVVGILTTKGKTCQLLVSEDGKPASNVRLVSITTYDGKSARNKTLPSQDTSTRRRQPPIESLTDAGSSVFPNLTPEQNQKILQCLLLVVVAIIILRVLANSSLGGLLILVMPLLYLYAVQTCPTANSFDAKKELKRVLRGHHLPEGNPNKPKGFLEEMAARVAASVTTELATFPGYEIEMTDLAGAAMILYVRIPSANLQCYWVGAFDRWFYVTSFENQE